MASAQPPAPTVPPSPAPTAGYRFWVVPHTHWDREWYLPFQFYRLRLARTVDQVLEVLEQDPAFGCFTLDGQAVVLEDYLEVRPEQEARLRALVAAGRIALGPFYVLQDEYLVGQESLVRNLLLGRQVCQRFGRPLEVGYLPDTFGHVAQMPQVLRGFGLDSFVFWRGLGDEADELGAVFTWQAPDGSEVTAVRQLGGYGNAFELGRWSWTRGDVRHDPAQWPDTAVERVREFFDHYRGEFEKVEGLRDILLCNGLDHRPIQPELPRLLEHCRQRLPDTALQIGTYADYLAALREQPLHLKTHRGELCGGREANVLRGVNSARVPLKQLNEATERELLVAETLAALAALRAAPRAPSPLWSASLRVAWRELLRNQPHDSICGCSVDQVHRDMLPRYETARQIARAVQTEALAALAGQETPWDFRFPPAEQASLVNVLPYARVRAVELPLPPSLRRAPALVAETSAGPVPAQLYRAGGQRRAVVAVRVAGFGAEQVRLARATVSLLAPSPRLSIASSPATLGGPSIQNDFYRVEAAPNGTLRVTDLRSGRVWSGLHLLEDQADRGDEYTFCPLEGDRPWTSVDARARARVAADGPAVWQLEIELVARLPRSLTPDRRARTTGAVPCPVRTVVRLAAGVDRVEFRTTVLNRAKDHRLRVLFPSAARGSGEPSTPLPAGKGQALLPSPLVGEGQGGGAPPAAEVRAEGHFALLRRPARPIWKGRGWLEPPADTHHTLGLVAAGDLVVLTKGLPEYEAIPHPDGSLSLALTLLRCVGWLSRDDLPTRPDGHAGPSLETPEAQCLGAHTFEYALSLRGQASEAELVRAAQDYRVDLALGPPGADTRGLLQVEGEGFALSALKPAEDANGLILRLYNPGQQPAEARLSGAFAFARRCRLDETAAQAEEARTVPLHPGEIVTVRLR